MSTPETPQRGLLFILSAPAGTGKTTLVQMLSNEFPHVIASISYTTRSARPEEVDGVHYHFITEEQFSKKIARGEFLEYVQLYGFYYGTSKIWVDQKRAEGKHVFLVIDTQGARLLKGKSDAISIFLAPPSYEELERRLLTRKTEDLDLISTRLEWAKKEMARRKTYDYAIVNDQLPIAYDALRSIVVAEEHRIR